ncbi:hypothetical protein L7F22_008257, partial [Adiantum nelumboides]|nr:hypothetical protein [Adiantum nelumboides]
CKVPPLPGSLIGDSSGPHYLWAGRSCKPWWAWGWSSAQGGLALHVRCMPSKQGASRVAHPQSASHASEEHNQLAMTAKGTVRVANEADINEGHSKSNEDQGRE